MRNEAFSLTTLEPASNEHIKPAGYIEVAETIEAIVERMRTIHSSQVALVTIVLGFEPEGKAHGSRLGLANRSALHYLENLRTLVRKTDSVFLLRHTFYFVLRGADLQGSEVVQERLWDALLWCINNTLETDYLRPHRMTIGRSSCSTPFSNIPQCIDAATEVQHCFHVPTEKSTRKTVVARETETETALPELARKLGIPYVSILPGKVPAKVQRLISSTLAQELHCFPIGRDHDILTVAMGNPQDRCALDRLQKETGLNIFPVLAHPQELKTALERLS
jgi:hypothetical protein